MTKTLRWYLENYDTPLSDKPLYVYGIFDGVAYEKLWVNLECEWNFTHTSLFEDETLAVSMNNVAPYLVHISLSNLYVDKLLNYYGYDGCIFFCTHLTYSEALQKMRELFVIHSPEAGKGYLRFYRPSIFTEVIKHNPFIQQHHFFHDIECYYCEDEDDPNRLYRYTLSEKQLHKEMFDLSIKGKNS